MHPRNRWFDSVPEGQNGPEPCHPEKTYDFSALYICLRDRHMDGIWHAQRWRHFAVAGVSHSINEWPFLNGWIVSVCHAQRIVGSFSCN